MRWRRGLVSCGVFRSHVRYAKAGMSWCSEESPFWFLILILLSPSCKQRAELETMDVEHSARRWFINVASCTHSTYMVSAPIVLNSCLPLEMRACARTLIASPFSGNLIGEIGMKLLNDTAHHPNCTLLKLNVSGAFTKLGNIASHAQC